MKIKLAILLLSCSAMVFSCKKYEDGPSLSFRSKQQRVVNNWGPSEVIHVKDGVRTDSTAFYTDARYEFLINDTYTITDYTKSGQDSFYIFEEGTWSLENDKEEIRTTGVRFTYLEPQKIKQSEHAVTRTWEIKRLRETSLWLWLTISDTEHYEFKFEPK